MKPLKPRNNDWKGKDSTHLRNLRYGRTYYVAFQGITEGIEFTLKKKKVVPCTWIDGTVTYERVAWIRSILNSGFIHFSFEVDTSIREEAEEPSISNNPISEGNASQQTNNSFSL